MNDPDPTPAPSRDWFMLAVILGVVAALGLGGMAMMYQRAAASKKLAEAVSAQAIAERDRAETALKEANAQRRLAEQAKARADQAIAAEEEARIQAMAAKDINRAPVIEAERHVDKTQAAKADATAKFAQALGSAKPLPAGATPVDMRSVLDASAKELESGKLKDNPAAAAGVHSTLGRTYLSLGDSTKAADHLRQAIALRKPILGAKNAEVVKDEQALARATGATSPAPKR